MVKIFFFVLIASFWSLSLRAWPPVAGPQEVKLLVEIEDLRKQVAKLTASDVVTDSPKFALYLVGGYAFGATLSQLLEFSHGPWILASVGGLMGGLFGYLIVEDVPRLLFKRAKILRKIEKLAERVDQFSSTRERFEHLVLDMAIGFHPLVALERLGSQLDRWRYLNTVAKLVFRYSSRQEVSGALHRAFRVLYRSLDSLEIHAAKQGDLSAIYRSSQLRMNMAGFLGNLARKTGLEAQKNLAEHLGLPLETLNLIVDEWNLELKKSKEIGSKSPARELLDFLPVGSKIRAELSVSDAVFSLRVPQEVFDSQDPDWFQKFKQSPGLILGSGFWIRFPELDQKAWHFYRLEDPLFEKISSPLGHAELSLNPFDSRNTKILNWQSSFFDQKVYQQAIKQALMISNASMMKSICSKFLSAFF